MNKKTMELLTWMLLLAMAVALAASGGTVYASMLEAPPLPLGNGPTAAPVVVGTVLIPASPRGIAVNSSTHRAYVAVGDGFGNGTNSAPFYVSVIDGTTDIADIAVGAGDFSTGPTHIAVNEINNRVYVNHTGANFANAINAGTNSVIGSIGTGAYPEGIVTNPATNRLYIANTNSGNVSVIDTMGDANTLVTTIGIPGAGAGITNLYMAIIPATNRIFVTAPGLSKIFVIDGGSNTVVQTFVVTGNPYAIVANPTTNRLYTATGGTVSVLDATTGASVAVMSVGSSTVQGLAVNATLNHIYATSSSSSVLTVIDGATNTIYSTIDVGATALSVGADALSGRVYVGTSAKTVVVVNDLPATPPPFLLKWGSLGSGDGQFNVPSGVAVDGSGNVYVADYNNHRIQKFTSGGAFITKWGALGSGDGQFINPFGVAVDGSGNVYVADTFNHRIQKFTSSGAFITKWGAPGSGDGQFQYPDGVAVDASGNVYVADRSNHRIQKFSSSGAFITKWGAYGSGDGQFNFPTGVAVDASGNVYVAESGNNRIQKFSSSGAFITKWGAYGSGDGQFYEPYGVAVDISGNVYVADYNNHIQKFTSSGAFIAKWGAYGTGNGQFQYPNGVAVDISGNVYVADYNNHRIQKFGIFVNNPPVATASSVTGTEDTTYTFASSNFAFTDVENDPLTKVMITTLPAAGTLKLSGANVTAGQQIVAASIGNLTFDPAANASGSPYTTFTFKVEAGAGSWSAAAATMTINITATPTPPKVKSLPAGLQAWKAGQPEIDLSVTGQSENTQAIIGHLIGAQKVPVAELSLAFSQATGDIDFASQMVAEADIVNAKAVLHRASYPSGVATAKALYVRKLPQHNRVRVVPGAQTLAQVYSGAPGSYVLTLADSNLTVTSVEGVEYWKISGLTGTGAQGETGFTLTVTKAGTGSGTVASSPVGINCGTDCSEDYSSGTSVTLAAGPSSGSNFGGWNGGGCTGTDVCTVTMTAATTVIATFGLMATPTPTSTPPTPAPARSLPDPATWALILSGLAFLSLYAILSRRRRKT